MANISNHLQAEESNEGFSSSRVQSQDRAVVKEVQTHIKAEVNPCGHKCLRDLLVDN